MLKAHAVPTAHRRRRLSCHPSRTPGSSAPVQFGWSAPRASRESWGGATPCSPFRSPGHWVQSVGFPHCMGALQPAGDRSSAKLTVNLMLSSGATPAEPSRVARAVAWQRGDAGPLGRVTRGGSRDPEPIPSLLDASGPLVDDRARAKDARSPTELSSGGLHLGPIIRDPYQRPPMRPQRRRQGLPEPRGAQLDRLMPLPPGLFTSTYRR